MRFSQTFSEILRISEKDWQLSPRFSAIHLNCKLFSDMLMLLKNILGEPWTVANPSPRTGDSIANPSQRFYESPRNIYTLSSVSRRTANQKSWNFFFPIYFYGFLCICTSAAPQRPAHGTVSSQVATHLRTDRVFRVLGRSWI